MANRIPPFYAEQTQVYVVNAFSEEIDGGNPAGVCVLPTDTDVSSETLQKLAADMGYSETAFVKPLCGSILQASLFSLRWFTPTKEVPLCGHATLATSHVLFNVLGNNLAAVHFQTKSGELICRKQDSKICMDFPMYSYETIETIGSLKLKEAVFSSVAKKLLLVLDTSTPKSSVEALQPNLDLLMEKYPNGPVFGIIVSTQGSKTDETDGIKQYDFVSRYFAPWMGIREDPVTGSAHCLLAPYWSKQLNKQDLFARQCSARGGELRLKLRSDNRLDILGTAVLRELRILFNHQWI